MTDYTSRSRYLSNLRRADIEKDFRTTFLALEQDLVLHGTAPTYSALPLVGNLVGDLRVVVDEMSIYMWSGTLWVLPSWVNTRDVHIFDDMLGAASGGTSGFGLSTSGLGATSGMVSNFVDSSHLGVRVFDCGTQAVTYAFMHLNTVTLVLGPGSTLVEEVLIYIPALSALPNTYNIQIGFGDNITTSADPANGVYIEYAYLSSPNWRFCTAANSVRTKSTSNVPVTTGVWTKLRVVATGTLASFYVGPEGSEPTLIGTINTNLPTLPFGPVCRMLGTAGTGARRFYMDYFSLRLLYASRR